MLNEKALYLGNPFIKITLINSLFLHLSSNVPSGAFLSFRMVIKVEVM